MTKRRQIEVGRKKAMRKRKAKEKCSIINPSFFFPTRIQDRTSFTRKTWPTWPIQLALVIHHLYARDLTSLLLLVYCAQTLFISLVIFGKNASTRTNKKIMMFYQKFYLPFIHSSKNLI